MRKIRVYNFEDCKMWIANDYEELSALFMALSADDSMYSDPMQSIGLKGKNGKEIFEGDIVYEYSEGVCLIGVIEYLDNEYFIKDKDGIYHSLWTNAEQYEIIGNIYDNSEFWEEE